MIAPVLVLVALSGTVVERGTREPIASATVSVSWPGQAGAAARPPASAVTDAQGRFALGGLPEGPAQVEVSGPGLAGLRRAEVLRAGRAPVTYYVPRRGAYGTVVRAGRGAEQVVRHVLDAEDIKHIAGTDNDVLRAAQNLPGVARASFGGGSLIVWGSSPQDTRVFADGVPIPRLYHFGGVRSTVNSEFVSQLAFQPGAYGAEYGRGLGGIVDITTRAPKSDRFHGSLTLDLIDGSFTIEGPITPKLHVAAAARVSWISVFLPLFNRSATQIKPFYWDYQLAVRYLPTSRDELELLVFGSSDQVRATVQDPDPVFNVDLTSKSYFSRARLRWTRRLGPETVLTVMPWAGADSSGIDAGTLGIGGLPLRASALQAAYGLRAVLRGRLLGWLSGEAGLDFEGQSSQVDFLAVRTPPGLGASDPGDTTGFTDIARDGAGPAGALVVNELAASGVAGALREQITLHLLQVAPYLSARFELFGGRLVVTPQLRLEVAMFGASGASQGGSTSGEVPGWRSEVAPEPRLLVRGEVWRGRMWLKAGVGVFHQAATADQLTPNFGNPALGLQFGTTYAAGVDAEVTSTLHVEAQGFYKDLRSLIVPDAELGYVNGGLGRVYGGELLVRQRPWHNLYGWVSYTLSRSERKDAPDQPWHLFLYDQTHILTILLGYKLPWGLEAGARFRYVTGNPTTPVIGGVRSVNDQSYTWIYGAPYTIRLPDFNQLDLRLDKSFVFNRWKLGIYLDVQNVYYEKNAEALTYGGRQAYQQGRVVGVPVFPNLGVRADY